MKKAISTVLVAAMLASGAGSTFAYTPSDTNDPKCIDIRNLNEKRWISLPEKPGKKVCGFKNCNVDVITFDKMPEYLQNLQKELKELDQDIRTNENKSVIEKMADCNRAAGIKIALNYMKADIEAKNYLYGNYYLTSMNNYYNDFDSIGMFAQKDGITYSFPEKYNEAYFSSMIPQIDKILENREAEDILNEKYFKAMEPKLRVQDQKKENMIFWGVVLSTRIVVSSIIGFLYHANTLRHKGQIKSKVMLYVLEKLFGSVRLGN